MMSNALMARRKNERSEARRAIAQTIIEQYQLTNVEETQDALKDIFGSMFEARLQVFFVKYISLKKRTNHVKPL